jgi:hypothetical protein
MSIHSIAVVVLLVPLALFVALKLADFTFWCFCWCFCRVDEYFQERYMRIIRENLKRLEGIAAESERKSEAA